MPKISVVLAVYNGEKFLRAAIQSILQQTESDFELLIIDDGSTDQTESIIRSFVDTRILYYKKVHAGLIASLNFGLLEAKGEYVARMDADDISLPDRFRKQLNFLEEHPEVGICGSWAEVIDESDKIVGQMSYSPIQDQSIRLGLLISNPFIHPTVMLRKSVLDTIGYYRDWFKHTEDYELWTRVLSVSKGATLPEFLLQYRKHVGQITPAKKWQMRGRGIAIRFLGLMRILR